MRSEVTGFESSTDDALQTAGRPPAGPGDRATPLILPAVMLRAAPGPDSDWPVLVAAHREAEETWADFLEGDASVYDLMRAQRLIDVLMRR
ncbi:MAG: hypothetical protein ACYS9X_09225 [Planctomycetota bacterium]